MTDLATAMSRYNLDPAQSQLSEDLASKIQVRVRDPRTVIVKVPTGVNVLILTTESHSMPPKWVIEP